MSKNILKAKVSPDKLIYPRYYNDLQEGDWGILACNLIEVIEGEAKVNKYGNITIRGLLPKFQSKAEYLLVAELTKDEKYGEQFEIIFFSQVYDFKSREEGKVFLSMVLSETQVNVLYDQLEDPIKVISERDADTLTKISGIGAKTAQKLIDKYYGSIDYSYAYVILHEYGLSKAWITKLLTVYPSPDIIIQKIRSNPYILIKEVDGVGWSKADEIALNNGMDELDIKRIKACLMHCLSEQENEGNSWSDPWDIICRMEDMIGEFPKELRTQAFTELSENKEIWFNDDKTMVSSIDVMRLEQAIFNELKRLAESPNTFTCDNFDVKIKAQEEEQGWEFTEEQIIAIRSCLEDNVAIITGSAGTGKSSVVAAVVKILSDYDFAQTALAGRAADRLREITGEDGFTIHRLLGYTPEGFTYTKANPIPTDIVILDETSMVGGVLFYQLIQAIESGKKLIMLGDDGQLPAIGLLSVFSDMMESGVISTHRLNKIHRQAQKSAIITESLKVRDGKQLVKRNSIGSEIRGVLQDLELDLYDDKVYTPYRVIEHFKKEYDKLKDISQLQIILPVKTNGSASVFAINQKIQEIYNPVSGMKNSVTIGSPGGKFNYSLRVGDKIIVRKNNRKQVINENGTVTPVFNGNLGIIVDIDTIFNQIVIDLNGMGRLLFPKSVWNSIELGYAITCHSFQGSSAHTIIIGVDFTGFTLLSKEWLYTAITRAEKYCVLCAETKALSYAINTSNVPHKRTFLKQLLRGESFN